MISTSNSVDRQDSDITQNDSLEPTNTGTVIICITQPLC